jgi:hypothetical protein
MEVQSKLYIVSLSVRRGSFKIVHVVIGYGAVRSDSSLESCRLRQRTYKQKAHRSPLHNYISVQKVLYLACISRICNTSLSGFIGCNFLCFEVVINQYQSAYRWCLYDSEGYNNG